jgi:hypothetical protein
MAFKCFCSSENARKKSLAKNPKYVIRYLDVIHTYRTTYTHTAQHTHIPHNIHTYRRCIQMHTQHTARRPLRGRLAPPMRPAHFPPMRPAHRPAHYPYIHVYGIWYHLRLDALPANSPRTPSHANIAKQCTKEIHERVLLRHRSSRNSIGSYLYR